MTRFSWLLLLFVIPILAPDAYAGVVNPNISAIGQILMAYPGVSVPATPGKVSLGIGELELQLDSPLNPYLNGAFVFSIGKDAFEIEEAYASVVRGLPLNMGMKVGKYRVGFGRLNPAHPHAYPFIRAPRTIDPGAARLLPGDESFNDTGVQVSTIVPVSESYGMLVSADLLQGDSFHPDTSAATPGWIARVVNSFVVGEQTMTELGLSLSRGTNDPRNNTKSSIVGADLKTKIIVSPTVNLAVQAEIVRTTADHNVSPSGISRENRAGFYVFADAQFQNHYNAGVLYEQYSPPAGAGKTNRGVKPFIGFNVLEESTVLRFAYEHFIPAVGRATNSAELQFLFSMGPHKAHQF